MCQAKLQQLSLTYKCKHETKNRKVLLRKQRVTKIVIISDTKSCPVQVESGLVKVSCHRINYRGRLLNECPTIVITLHLTSSSLPSQRGLCLIPRCVKVGFHYPSSRPEFTGQIDGPRTRVHFFDTRQLGPSTRVVETDLN